MDVLGALYQGQPELARRLAGEADGLTLAEAAALHGDVELARILLAAGADPELANDAGVRPAELATQHGHHELAAEISDARTGRAAAPRPPGSPAGR